MLKRTWMAWVTLSLCTAVFACGCQTLGAVNQLAQAVVGTAVKATNSVVDTAVKAVTTPPAQTAQVYSPWVRNPYGKPQNFAGNSTPHTNATSTGSRPVVLKRNRGQASTTTRYGVQVDNSGGMPAQPTKATNQSSNKPKVFRRGHKPTNSAWK